jgi:hypothetical protein
MNENIGKVATCQKRAIGVITGSKLDKNGRTVWTGKTLDNKNWQSVKPVILANSLEEYNAIPKEVIGV